jgi:hypothetical protein
MIRVTNRRISFWLLIAALLCSSTALGQVNMGLQVEPTTSQAIGPLGASVPPPPDALPAAGESTWPPVNQASLQSPVSGAATGQPASPPPGTYLVNPAPAQDLQPQAPQYPPPAPWLAEPSPGLGLIPGAADLQWGASLDSLWMSRDTGRGAMLGLTDYYSPGKQHASRVEGLWTDDETFPLEPGLRFQLVGRLNDRMTVETTYWGLQNWSVSRTIYGDSADQTVLGTSAWLQVPYFDDSLGYTYTSKVHNVEANHRIKFFTDDPYRSLSWLWGLRYFGLSEDLALTGTNVTPAISETLDWQTTNNLVGMQLGLNWTFGSDRFQLSTEAKAGLYANFYSQQGADIFLGGGWQSADTLHSGTSLAAVFELSVLLRYHLTSWMWLRAGYQYCGVTGLALAPRQLPGFDSDGTANFDGLLVGFEITR